MMNTYSGNLCKSVHVRPEWVFTLNQNRCSRSTRISVHVEPEYAVADNVTKKTTMLVVGDQDIRVLAGNSKSSKHRRAESLMLKGQKIRILAESDFEKLVSLI